jgi:hypothetical protein
VSYTNVLTELFDGPDFAFHTYDVNVGDPVDPNYPSVWFANQAVVAGGQLVTLAEGSTTGWRFAGVAWRNFTTTADAVTGGPSVGGRVTVSCQFVTDAFANLTWSTFPGYYVPLISVYGGGTALNAAETASNLAFQLVFFASGASDVGISLLYSDAVNGAGSGSGGAFDKTVATYTIPRAALEGNTFDVVIEWCNSSATHDVVTAWMTVGGSPAPAADGWVRAKLGTTTLYDLTDVAIVPFWQPGQPTRFNQWNKVMVGNSGLPGPVNSFVADYSTCVPDVVQVRPPTSDVVQPTYKAQDCCNTAQTGQGAVGSTPDVDDTAVLAAWVPSCAGGGTVPSAADVGYSENWDPA